MSFSALIQKSKDWRWNRFPDLIRIESTSTEVWDQNPATHQDFDFRRWKLTLEKCCNVLVESHSSVRLQQLLRHTSFWFLCAGWQTQGQLTSWCNIQQNSLQQCNFNQCRSVCGCRSYVFDLLRTVMRRRLLFKEILSLWCHEREIAPHWCLWYPCQWEDVQPGADSACWDVFATNSSCVSQNKISCATLKFKTPEMSNLTL